MLDSLKRHDIAWWLTVAFGLPLLCIIDWCICLYIFVISPHVSISHIQVLTLHKTYLSKKLLHESQKKTHCEYKPSICQRHTHCDILQNIYACQSHLYVYT